MARQRFEPGAVLRIGLDDSLHAYARMLDTHPYVAVYDVFTAADLSPEVIVRHPVLFVVAVYDSVWKTGRWTRVGAVPPDVTPVQIPEFFQQDRFNPGDCAIVDRLGNSRPATPQECVGLERYAVWDALHVEQRVSDHRANRPNANLEDLKLRLV